MDCIFCKIIEGSLPSRKIYEDEFTYVFLDIADDVDGHTLVIPKKHFVNILDCDEETLSHLMATVQKVSKHYVDNCGYQGVNLLCSNEKAAQQVVFHLHFHVIPRKSSDGIDGFPKFPGTTVSFDEMFEKLKMG